MEAGFDDSYQCYSVDGDIANEVSPPTMTVWCLASEPWTLDADADGPGPAAQGGITTRDPLEADGYARPAPQRSVCTVKVAQSVTNVAEPCSLVRYTRSGGTCRASLCGASW